MLVNRPVTLPASATILCCYLLLGLLGLFSSDAVKNITPLIGVYILASIILQVGLFFLIWRGRNWARLILLAFIALAVANDIYLSQLFIQKYPLLATIKAAQLFSLIFAMFLLLMPRTSQWLSRQTAQRNQEF